jgi:hypothetical protein
MDVPDGRGKQERRTISTLEMYSRSRLRNVPEVRRESMDANDVM